MHARVDMGSRERADMNLESQAISARVTKQLVTIFSKACDKAFYAIYGIDVNDDVPNHNGRLSADHFFRSAILSKSWCKYQTGF